MTLVYSANLVSVVVPSFNGLEKLKVLLPALNAQSYQPYEVLIVVDGSRDGSFEWLSKCSGVKDFRFILNIIYQENQGRGSAKANGADAAKGSIILFCDDDMVVSPQWVQSHVDAHLTADVITGPVRLCSKPKVSQEFFEYFSFLLELWDRENKARKYPLFTAANVSFKRSVYESSGGFSRSLRDAEDRDYSIRLQKLGVKISYCESCISYTVPYKSFKDYSMRLLEYRHGILKLEEKICLNFSTPPLTIKATCCRFFVNLKRFPPLRNLLVWFIDHQILIPLSSAIRYRVYTFILF